MIFGSDKLFGLVYMDHWALGKNREVGKGTSHPRRDHEGAEGK
jgi:hypothetical protein